MIGSLFVLGLVFAGVCVTGWIFKLYCENERYKEDERERREAEWARARQDREDEDEDEDEDE